MSKLAALSSVTAPLWGVSARPHKGEIIVRSNQDGPATPQATFSRRVDAIVTKLIVSTDTQDYFDRLQELRRALRQIEARSQNSRTVCVAFAKDVNVLSFTLPGAEAAIASKGPPDSSQASLLLRTPIVPGDTMDTAMRRIHAFRSTLPRHGRIEYSMDAIPDLTMVRPGQYRKHVIAAISDEVRAVTDALGAGYAARIEGLEQRMIWRRMNDLEMLAFIPYRLEIRPTGTG